MLHIEIEHDVIFSNHNQPMYHVTVYCEKCGADNIYFKYGDDVYEELDTGSCELCHNKLPIIEYLLLHDNNNIGKLSRIAFHRGNDVRSKYNTNKPNI